MSSLVVLGGADGAVGTYRRARRLGYRTICVDVRPDAPGVGVADEFVPISVRSPERIAEALAGRSDVIGVLSPASDMGLASQSWLTGHWRLPRPLPAAAVAASVDKSVFRGVCERLGLPRYGTAAGEPGPGLTSAVARLRFPVLVKPVDSSGGRGIVPAVAPGGVPDAVARALAFSRVGRVVVEEYVEGRQLSVEAVLVAGEVAFHAVTDRAVTPPPFYVTTSHLMPALLAPRVDRDLVDMLTAVCAQLGYRDGPLTVDAVLGHDGVLYLIEVATRLGGNGLAELVDACCGVDLVDAMIVSAVGGVPRLTPRPPRPGMAVMLTAERAGQVLTVEGVAAARAMPEVVQLDVFAREGTVAHRYEQAGHKIGYAVLLAQSLADLRRAQRVVLETLRVTVDGDPQLPVDNLAEQRAENRADHRADHRADRSDPRGEAVASS